jgi:DNA-binding HxlR family transcriptional regulator
MTEKCSSSGLEAAIEILGGRWKAMILFHLFSSSVMRFSELHRAIKGISQKMLIQQLRDLEDAGVVTRRVYPEVPPKVEYSLTAAGLALQPSLQALQEWATSRYKNPEQQ